MFVDKNCYFCALNSFEKDMKTPFIQIEDKQFELFISEEDILEGIDRVSTEINKDFQNKKPLFLCVLNGAFMFASELIGRFESECEVTFIGLKSYKGTERNENIKTISGLNKDIKDRNVIIIEDIIDSGFTMDFLLKTIKDENPKSVRVASLLFKPDALQTDIRPDYTVKKIANDFIVGFGLDYKEQGRNLRNIYKIKY